MNHWKARAEAAEIDRDRERGLRELADNWAAIHAKQAAALRDLEQAARALNREAIREALVGRAEDWDRSDQYRQRYLFALGDIGSLFAVVDALPAEEADA